MRTPLFHGASAQSVKVGGSPEKRSHIFRTNVPVAASRSPSESSEEPAGGSR